MAQVILCDAHNMEHPADWLVTHMADGEAQAYCDDGYRELMVSTVEAMNAAEIDQTDAEAERRLAAAQAPAPTGDQLNDEHADRLAASLEREADAERDGTDPADPDNTAGNTSDMTAAVEPAHVVRRGQSQKARQHQAAQELRAEREAATATATVEPGDDDEDDDADAQEAATPPA
jgi:hypothetical protein